MREHTGKGQFVDISITDTVTTFLATFICGHLLSGEIPRPGGVRRYGGDPSYNFYETKDGKYIGLGCREPEFVRNLCRVLGKEDLAELQNTGEQKYEETFSYI